jgi:hypothetical protein
MLMYDAGLEHLVLKLPKNRKGDTIGVPEELALLLNEFQGLKVLEVDRRLLRSSMGAKNENLKWSEILDQVQEIRCAFPYIDIKLFD